MANAVRQGISGVGDLIAEAIKGLVMEIPGVDLLIAAANTMADAARGVQAAVDTIFGNTGHAGETPVYSAAIGDAYPNKIGGYDVVFKQKYSSWEPGQTIQGINEEDLRKLGFPVPETSYAVGATFQKGGLFSGMVHAPEEIIPRAIAQKGPGPISKALDSLNSSATAATTKSPGVITKAVDALNIRSSITPPGSVVNNNNPQIHVHAHIDKLANDFDLRKLEGMMECVAIRAVKNSLAQRRT